MEMDSKEGGECNRKELELVVTTKVMNFSFLPPVHLGFLWCIQR